MSISARKAKGTRIRDSRGDRVFTVVNYIILTLFGLAALYPLIYVLSASISEPLAVNSGRMKLWPVGFNIEGYKSILSNKWILTGYGNSLFYTVVGTFLNVLVTFMASYSLSRKDMYGHGLITFFMVFTMWFGGGLIPTYLVYKAYRLTNSFLVYILPAVVDAYYVILIKTYVEQLPISVEESAMIDGAGTMCIFLKIILPMSLPIVATIAIYASVGQWNSWFDNHIYAISNKKILTLQYMLYRYLQEAESIVRELKERDPGAAVPITPRGVRMTVTMITVVPVLCIYPFFQRYLIKGLMIGAVKG